MQHAVFLPVLLAALAASGCAATPNLDRQFGHSVAQLRQRQMLSPQAGANRDPVAGMDGKASREALIQYQNSFKTPPPAVNVINLGATLGR